MQGTQLSSPAALGLFPETDGWPAECVPHRRPRPRAQLPPAWHVCPVVTPTLVCSRLLRVVQMRLRYTRVEWSGSCRLCVWRDECVCVDMNAHVCMDKCMCPFHSYEKLNMGPNHDSLFPSSKKWGTLGSASDCGLVELEPASSGCTCSDLYMPQGRSYFRWVVSLRMGVVALGLQCFSVCKL